jgi:lipoprotein signal peptidase
LGFGFAFAFCLFGLCLVESKGWLRMMMVLILSGGFSNWLDRLLYGGVRDVIYYPVFDFYGNMADIYLTIGACVILYQSVVNRLKG